MFLEPCPDVGIPIFRGFQYLIDGKIRQGVVKRNQEKTCDEGTYRSFLPNHLGDLLFIKPVLNRNDKGTPGKERFEIVQSFFCILRFYCEQNDIELSV